MFRFVPTEISDVILVEPHVHRDDRGFFLETYHGPKFTEGGIPDIFVQDNHSLSCRGTLRGLHTQLEHAQGKLVRAIEGEVFDVAVDIRISSPSFGRWVSAVLSDENYRQMYVPPGFAHGFCVLSERAQIEYKCTQVYAPGDEIAIAWNDPDIGIDWPIENPILSEKDRKGQRLCNVRELLAAHPATR